MHALKGALEVSLQIPVCQLMKSCGQFFPLRVVGIIDWTCRRWRLLDDHLDRRGRSSVQLVFKILEVLGEQLAGADGDEHGRHEGSFLGHFLDGIYQVENIGVLDTVLKRPLLGASPVLGDPYFSPPALAATDEEVRLLLRRFYGASLPGPSVLFFFCVAAPLSLADHGSG